MAKASHHLLCYDISDPSALRKVAAYLKKRGSRLQKSIFLLFVTPKELLKIKTDLQKIVGEKDSLLLLPLCAGCVAKAETTGKPFAGYEII